MKTEKTKKPNRYAEKMKRENTKEDAKMRKRNIVLCMTMNDRIMNDLRLGIVKERDITTHKFTGERSSCTDCSFFAICPRLPNLACMGHMRNDRKSVLYVENKKV